MSEFEPVIFENGTASLKPARGTEAMHSSIGPMEEARAVYVLQTGLRERLLAPGDGPLVLLDAGLGIAANAIAALEEASSLRERARPLRIVSFENELQGLAEALSRPRLFAYLSPWACAARAILSAGTWSDAARGLHWELRRGDFRAEVRDAPPADVVFYDFYSPKTSPELWTRECFATLRSRLREPANGAGPILATYVASTAARAAMLGAGLWAAAGRSTARKAETTLAALQVGDFAGAQPLGREWLAKLARSPAAAETAGLASHPQFVDGSYQ